MFEFNIENRKFKDVIKKTLVSFNLETPVYNLLVKQRQEIAIRQLKKILKNSRLLDIDSSNGKKVLFNSIVLRYEDRAYREMELAMALQMRGHNVKVLTYGNAFAKPFGACATIQHIPNKHSCKNCKNFFERCLNILNIPHLKYEDYIDKNEILEITNRVNNMPLNECENFIYKNVKTSKYAISSTDKFFLGATPEKTNYSYEDILRSNLINAVISTEVAERLLKSEKPDVLVTSHIYYSFGGSFAEYLENNKIRVIHHGIGYKKDTIFFDPDKFDEYFEEYYNIIRKRKSLDKKEEKELETFLNKRIKGEEGDTAEYGFSLKKEKKDIENKFNFDKFDKTYVIFPNLPWDASLIGANKTFKDVYEWISNTIELFKEKPNLQLIIKIHPSEKLFESESTVLDYINDNFEYIPKNIKIIPPDTKTNPYSLFPFVDVGIVYNGTIGLEMALNGIPVVVAGSAHYSGKGFTYDVSTKNEYDNILFNDISILPKQQGLAKVYSYFYFIKSFIPRNFIYYKNFLSLGWNINSLNEFAKGNDQFIDHMCDYIVNGGIIQNW